MAIALMSHRSFISFVFLVWLLQLNFLLSLPSCNQSYLLQTKPYYFPNGQPHPNIKPENDSVTNERQSASNCECGLSNEDKIVSGTEAFNHQFPWMVYLVINKGHRSALCGGFLVTDLHVLTAAHCTNGVSQRAVKLTLGTNDFDDDSAVQRTSRSVVVHPDYDSEDNINDVSVITMDSPVSFSSNVLPICLPSNINNNYVGRTGIIAGWGTLSEGGHSNNALRTGTIPVLANDDRECTGAYGRSITPQMICAGGKETDTCQGDSGGPLMIANGNTFTAIGIVSFGVGCGRPQTPGIYARLTALMSFVNREISNGETCN